MFAYCLNNLVNFKDNEGNYAVALKTWTVSMCWLPAIDTALPIGDIVYIVGILVLGGLALASNQNNCPKIRVDVANSAYSSPSPNQNNNDDDDDDCFDDDYFDDDSNFGGRQKIGKSKGNTPGNNQAQKHQYNYGKKNIPKKYWEQAHNTVSGQGFGYKELMEHLDMFKHNKIKPF